MKTSDNWAKHAKIKAWLVCGGFALWTIFTVFVLGIYPQYLSILFFYILLVTNTFFSIRIFATITPTDNWGQKFWDALLFFCLVSLPLSFSSPVWFVFINTLLFIIATLKYIFLIPLVGFTKLLHKKIRIDTLGILLCLTCLAGVMINITYTALNIWVITFFIANNYVLWYKPLYKLEHHLEKYLNI
jgi:hypothetical protein